MAGRTPPHGNPAIGEALARRCLNGVSSERRISSFGPRQTTRAGLARHGSSGTTRPD